LRTCISFLLFPDEVTTAIEIKGSLVFPDVTVIMIAKRVINYKLKL